MGLMIDTMCNGVGGLVLVAILIVLVSIGESPSSAEGQMQRKQLENEVEALEIKQELLRSENQRMSGNRDAFGEEFVKAISTDEIEKQVAVLQEKKKRIQDLERRLEELQQEQAKAQLADPGEYVAAELEEFNRLRTEVGELEAQLKKAEKELASKESEYSELLSQVAEIKERKSQTLRTPVERKYDRYDFFYFRYGKCYMLPQESQVNSGPQFNILHEDANTIIFEPKRGSGISLNSREMRDFLSFVKRKGGTCQLGFYPDSFDLYLPMKALIDEYGLSLGINFHTDAMPPGFTSVGGTDIMGQGQ
jgi:hypothetical protein